MGAFHGRIIVKTILKSAAAAAVLLSFASFSPAQAAGIGACLITKENANPFFVKMKEGATAKAAELGVDFKAYAGKQEGDTEGQVAAVETCIAGGAKGILITPSDSRAMVPVLKQARDAGILVIALDTPLDPIEAADQTMATDNFEAGRLIGAYAAAKLGDRPRMPSSDSSTSTPSRSALTCCATRAS